MKALDLKTMYKQNITLIVNVFSPNQINCSN